MASISALFCTCMMLMMVMLVTTNVPVEAVKEFKVGGDMGWVLPDVNNSATYNQWASRNRFHIGDSLCEFLTIFLVLAILLKNKRKVTCWNWMIYVVWLRKLCTKLWLVYVVFLSWFLKLSKNQGSWVWMIICMLESEILCCPFTSKTDGIEWNYSLFWFMKIFLDNLNPTAWF